MSTCKLFFGSLIVFIVFLLLLNSCYYDSKEYLFPEISGSCDTTSITYSGTVQPIIQSSCLGCHSNASAASFGGNIRLEEYPDVLLSAENGSLIGTIMHDANYSPMPKGSAKLGECQITSITKWVQSGAPNN